MADLTLEETMRLKAVYLEIFNKLSMLNNEYLDEVILGLEEYSISLDNKIEGGN